MSDLLYLSMPIGGIMALYTFYGKATCLVKIKIKGTCEEQAIEEACKELEDTLANFSNHLESIIKINLDEVGILEEE